MRFDSRGIIHEEFVPERGTISTQIKLETMELILERM
jgi:hypothetical protein